jgi:hypothetical protein
VIHERKLGGELARSLDSVDNILGKVSWPLGTSRDINNVSVYAKSFEGFFIVQRTVFVNLDTRKPIGFSKRDV